MMTTALYDHYQNMADSRGKLAALFAKQIISTTGSFISKPPSEWDVLDVGCGYGHTLLEISKICRRAVGIEPTPNLFNEALKLLKLKLTSHQSNCVVRQQNIYELDETDAYDLVILDNVFEHLPDQPRALSIISRSLRIGGAAYLLMPNKLWPIEVHYKLPFLSYLPLQLANLYLKITRRGTDYTDASYAPTYFRLCHLLNEQKEFKYQFVLPAIPTATMSGSPWHYRLGMQLLKRFPALWLISKSFLVIAQKTK
ncbi:MAG: class I SAM-dependent methyltransferase [Gemmata sp.]|nr:class I SAM-dependent methyltransferase [Gemmata sp.]